MMLFNVLRYMRDLIQTWGVDKSGVFNTGWGVVIKSRKNLRVGNQVHLGDFVWINASGGITIGDNTIVGVGAVIHSANHRYKRKNLLIRRQGHDFKCVTIGSDVWIGARAIILAGVTIGDGAVIGAGSVVTKDVNPFSVVMGVPARLAHIRNDT